MPLYRTVWPYTRVIEVVATEMQREQQDVVVAKSLRISRVIPGRRRDNICRHRKVARQSHCRDGIRVTVGEKRSFTWAGSSGSAGRRAASGDAESSCPPPRVRIGPMSRGMRAREMGGAVFGGGGVGAGKTRRRDLCGRMGGRCCLGRFGITWDWERRI